VWPELRKQIALEIAQLREILGLYEPLIEKCRTHEPSFFDLSALGAFLHSLYNGIESIFRRTCVELEEPLPEGEAWHQLLLEAMTEDTAGRPRVVADELHQRLLEYLQFRHLFRNTYTFHLRWEKMAHLVFGAAAVVEALERELATFVDLMEKRY
jgi:hypothetical protein